MYDNYYVCRCWQGYLEIRQSLGLSPEQCFKSIAVVNGLFSEILLAQFFSAMLVSYSRLALVSNADMKHSVE